MNQHVDFRIVDGINRIGDSYLPSPVKKSAAIAKLQSRFAAAEMGAKHKRNFKIEYDGDLTTRPVHRTPPPPPLVKMELEPSSPVTVINREPIKVEPQKQEEDVAVTSPVRTSSLKKPGQPRSKTPERRVRLVEPKKYKSWDFGKKKVFVKPPVNRKTTAAATNIQRIARGGMQRLHYKVMRLEHLLNSRDQRTQADIDKINAKNDERKEKYREKMQTANEKELQKLDLGTMAAQESQKIIAYLRKENKKLREKNEKVYTACHNLREQNRRLEDANTATDDSFSTLNAHAKQIQETYDKLKEVVPKYEASVKTLRDAVEERRQYCLSEHKIKVMYVKLLGNIVEKMELAVGEESLASEIVDKVMELEDQELHNVPVPPSVMNDSMNTSFNASFMTLGSDHSEDAEIQSHVVATMD